MTFTVKKELLISQYTHWRVNWLEKIRKHRPQITEMNFCLKKMILLKLNLTACRVIRREWRKNFRARKENF